MNSLSFWQFLIYYFVSSERSTQLVVSVSVLFGFQVSHDCFSTYTLGYDASIGLFVVLPRKAYRVRYRLFPGEEKGRDLLDSQCGIDSASLLEPTKQVLSSVHEMTRLGSIPSGSKYWP